jgi:hypothetical protein
MNTTNLASMIRECVDDRVSPVTVEEIRARAMLARHPAPVRRRVRLGVAATGVVAAGIAGALVASQAGGGTAATRMVLTAAMVRQVASASQAAMTSGQADIDWTSSGLPSVIQEITFDGENWNDVSNPGVPIQVHHDGRMTSWTGENINRVVDGQAYHYPALAANPQPHVTAGWMRMGAPGAGQPLDMPDPRTLLGVLQPSAGFTAAGYTTVNGARLEHLRATTPGAVSLAPLDDIIQSEPDNAQASALDLWIDPAGVVQKAVITVTGTNGRGTPQSATVTVTFSQIGQPQTITPPAS